MRILYDFCSFGQQRYGGISRYFSEIIPRIAASDDCRVSLFMGLYINRYGLEKLRDRYEHFWGHRRPFLPKTHHLSQKLNAWLFRSFAAKIPLEIYHTTSFFEPNLVANCKRVITVHDMIRFQNLWTVPQDHKDFLSRAIHQADAIICVSNHTKRDLMNHLAIAEEKITVVHHGAPAKHSPSPGRAVPDPYLLYVGFRPAYKNLALLMQVISEHPGLRQKYRLVLFGGGNLLASEKEQIEKLKLTDRVTMIPTGDDELLANLYGNAEVFVYPSTYEGFGIPILEAFTYGCPVVCSDSSSLPEVGGDAAAYFANGDAADLARQLTRVLDDQELRDSMIQRGTEQLKKFSWDRCASQTIEVYRRVMNA